jgi:uncharacterized protein DUF4157
VTAPGKVPEAAQERSTAKTRAKSPARPAMPGPLGWLTLGGNHAVTSALGGALIQRKCACGGRDSSPCHCQEEEKALAGIQPKLTVNQPGDQYEQEADRVADQVMRMQVGRALEPVPEEPTIHRVIRCRVAEPAPLVHQSTDGLSERLAEAGTDGRPLDPALRETLEPRFGVDFGDVRIHTGPAAAALSRDLDARAFTHGRDIYFGRGIFDPGTSAGQHLLAHELTHVVQQSAATALDHRPHHKAPSPVVQRAPLGALDVAQGVVDPKSLVGKAWLGLSPPVKLQLADIAIDGAVELIDAFPGQVQFGPFWDFMKEGLKGFYAGLKTAPDAEKLTAIDKIATIMAGRDQEFALAYLKGLLKGFFVDGALGIFIAIYDLIKALGKLWDFLKGIGKAIGNFPEEMQKLLDGFVNLGNDLTARFDSALAELVKLLNDPNEGSSLLKTIAEKGKTMAKEAGQGIAQSLLTFFSKPGASAAIGEAAGNVAGQILWEVAFAVVTAGGGAAATAAKTALKSVVETISKLLGKVVSGVLKIVREIRALFMKAIEWVKGAIVFIKGKLSELCERFAKLLEDVGEFFARLLRDCHESTLFCDFGQVLAKLLKINKGQVGALKELAGKIHMLRGVLEGQAIAIVEVRVGNTIRYAAATNAGAWGGWAPAQLKALSALDIKAIEPIGTELVHAEPHILSWVNDLKKTEDSVEVLRWGISAGQQGSQICYPCRTIIKGLGGVIEEFR